MDYVLHVATLAAIYSILAMALGIPTGECGMLSVCHASFFGIGAYAAALTSLHLTTSLPITLAAAGVIAATLGLLFFLPAVRLRKEAFVLSTFAFQLVVSSVLRNWITVTGGPLGIRDIPDGTLAGWSLTSRFARLCVCFVVAAIVYTVSRRISHSPFGRVLRAIREDEAFPAALGKHTNRAKMEALVASAAMAGLGGGLYAHYVGFIDPTSFTVTESIMLLSMVIIGGAGHPAGPLAGAILLVTVPELLRFVGLSQSAAANGRQVIYGLLLIGLPLVRPQGMIGRYRLR